MDILQTSLSFTPVEASVNWEWSIAGISRTADTLTERLICIYHCKNVFLLKIREWKASWEQSLPAGFLWKLTRSNEVWNWPTFKKSPKLQKRKWDSEIWYECKWRVLMIPNFVLGMWLLTGAQGKHCVNLFLTPGQPGPWCLPQKALDVFVDYTWLVTVI